MDKSKPLINNKTNSIIENEKKEKTGLRKNKAKQPLLMKSKQNSNNGMSNNMTGLV